MVDVVFFLFLFFFFFLSVLLQMSDPHSELVFCSFYLLPVCWELQFMLGELAGSTLRVMLSVVKGTAIAWGG